MKRIIPFRPLALLALVFSCVYASASDRFYTLPVNIEPEETKTLEFFLDNEQPYFGFQVDLLLPEGLEVMDSDGKLNIALSQRADHSYAIVSNTLADGTVRMGAFSTNHTALDGNSGVLVYINVKASSEFSGGSLSLGNMLFINAKDHDVALPDYSVPIGGQHNDQFYAKDLTIAVGQTKTVGLILDNETAFTAFQTDLYLPTGLMVEDGSFRLTDRASDGHTLSVRNFGDGRIRIACLSMDGSLFAGNSGTLVEFDVTAHESVVENCSIGLKNQICSTARAKEYYLPNSVANVTTELAQVSDLVLDCSAANLFVGETLVLHLTVAPSYAYVQDVVWGSSNPEIATVSSSGVVTAVAAGEAVITASATDESGVSASCSVTVNPVLAESLTLSATEWSGKVGDFFTLAATVLPENVTDKNITWSSSDRNIAMVDADGNVVARAVGEATITASCGNVTAICVVTVVATPAESVTLSQTTAQLNMGESVHLTATVYPETTTDKTVNWSSSNSEIATVDADGNVTAVSIGEATITASCGNVTAICTVTIVATPAESVTLSQTTALLNMGASIHLTATVYPETATDKTVNWSSSDSEIATVDTDGNVTAVSVGEVTITATAADGTGVSASCHVTVLPVLAESLTVTPESWDGMEGDSFTLVATVFPENATDKSVSWSSSDSEIATVDAEGNVRVLKDGYCTITASTQDGSNLSAECVITSVSGIDAIFKDDNASFDIYNLQGIQIKAGCRRDDLRKLPTGAYILRQGNVRKKIIIR